MPGHSTHEPHGSGIRGLSSLININGHEGVFGRAFPSLIAADFDESDLVKLAQAMISTPDAPKDAPDDEESHIPAAYTYFGQFVDHDLTFDPSTFAEQQSDPNGIIDFRSPRFDLDNVYGRGPGDQPFLYDGNKLAVGGPLTGAGRNPNAKDLPRAQVNSNGDRRAIIGDPRNDENAIVSQLQGMLFRFHNRVADLNPGSSFSDVQQIVRWHYQWIVLHDFLPRFVEKAVLDDISPAIADSSKNIASYPPRLKVYRFAGPIMPVEFSVAAYRMGHSMVRPGYRVNEIVPPLPIFDPVNPKAGLNAFGEFNSAWAIDWQRFVNLGLNQPAGDDSDRVQLAYKIDTSLVDPLSNLPHSVAGDEADADPRKKSLAFRNLLRGKMLGLPNGQAVARALGHEPLEDEEILIGKATADQPVAITAISKAFADNCPLWTYVLAEARHNWAHHGEARLGKVGGRIVAEVFLSLLLKDPRSFLSMSPAWKPTLGQNGKFELADLLNIALQG